MSTASQISHGALDRTRVLGMVTLISPPAPGSDGGCVARGWGVMEQGGPQEQLLGPDFGSDPAPISDPLIPPGCLLGVLAVPGSLPFSAPFPHHHML